MQFFVFMARGVSWMAGGLKIWPKDHAIEVLMHGLQMAEASSGYSPVDEKFARVD
jgi:hypothetical protein